MSSTENLEATIDLTSSYDKMSKLNALDDTHDDLKRLVDARITTIAQIVILPLINRTDSLDLGETHFIFLCM